MKSTRWVFASVLAIAVLLLTFGAGMAQDTSVNVTLGMSEFKFDPAELDVPVGTEVTFNVSNTGQFPHNVTFVAPDGTETDLFAENLPTGQNATGTFTFNIAGEWRMYCPVGQHEENGMVGIVRVAAAGAETATQPAATESGSDQSATSGTAATGSTNPATLPTTGGANPLVLVIAGATLLLLVGHGMRRGSNAKT